jgi:hypothetical protein
VHTDARRASRLPVLILLQQYTSAVSRSTIVAAYSHHMLIQPSRMMQRWCEELETKLGLLVIR